MRSLTLALLAVLALLSAAPTPRAQAALESGRSEWVGRETLDGRYNGVLLGLDGETGRYHWFNLDASGAVLNTSFSGTWRFRRGTADPYAGEVHLFWEGSAYPLKTFYYDDEMGQLIEFGPGADLTLVLRDGR